MNERVRYGKILSLYRTMPYFTESILPTFYSDRVKFTVTFPNLIRIWKEETSWFSDKLYIEDTNVTQDVTQGGTQESKLNAWTEKTGSKLSKIITEKLTRLSGKSTKVIKTAYS